MILYIKDLGDDQKIDNVFNEPVKSKELTTLSSCQPIDMETIGAYAELISIGPKIM